MSLVILIMIINMIIIFNKVMVGANELINQILGATNFIKSLLHCLKPKTAKEDMLQDWQSSIWFLSQDGVISPIRRTLCGLGIPINSKVSCCTGQFKAYSIKFRFCSHLTTQPRPVKKKNILQNSEFIFQLV